MRKQMMVRAWEIKRINNTTMQVAMILAWAEVKGKNTENKTVELTVSRDVKAGDFIVCEPSRWLGRKEREVFQVLSDPVFVKSVNRVENYSYYKATVKKVA